MRLPLVVLLVLGLGVLGCEDDPIIGPSDDDTGGGSYGTIHFSLPQETMRAPLEAPVDTLASRSTSADTLTATSADPRSANPYRF